MLNREGTLKLLDFGLAVCVDDRKPDSGSIVGTPQYMSPEQLRGDPIDARSDLYSLAVLFYELLVGRVPFVAEHDADLVRAQIEDPPPPLRDVVPEVPEGLEQVILQALSKRPDDRFASASELQQALEACLPAELCQAQPDSLAELASRPGSAFDLDGGDPPTRELDLGWRGSPREGKRAAPGGPRAWAAAAVLMGLLVFTLDYEEAGPSPAPVEPPPEGPVNVPQERTRIPPPELSPPQEDRPGAKVEKRTEAAKPRTETVRRRPAPKPKRRAADTNRTKTQSSPSRDRGSEGGGWLIQRQ